jgi:hypothetical protein
LRPQEAELRALLSVKVHPVA